MSKKTPALTPENIEDLITVLTGSRKYKHLGIPRETIRDLVHQAEARGFQTSDIERIVREKMHNLVAPYLGDPDYERMKQELRDLPRDLESPVLKEWCQKVMQSHASTRERIPILNEFYERIFAVTQKPRSILDLACGLNPFSLPWMGLGQETRYDAFDLHQPRVGLIEAFLVHTGQTGSAVHGDILVQPPRQIADVAFFYKEAHRFEQRQPGVNRVFFESIQARYLLVSLPTASLTGRRSMLEQDRRLIERSIADMPYRVQEIVFENEIVFCIEKNYEA